MEPPRNSRLISLWSAITIVAVDRPPSLDGQPREFDEMQLAPRHQPLKRHEEHSWFPTREDDHDAASQLRPVRPSTRTDTSVFSASLSTPCLVWTSAER